MSWGLHKAVVSDRSRDLRVKGWLVGISWDLWEKCGVGLSELVGALDFVRG